MRAYQGGCLAVLALYLLLGSQSYSSGSIAHLVLLLVAGFAGGLSAWCLFGDRKL